MENFSSKKVVGVRQDFDACILCGNISGLLSLDAQKQVVQQEDKPIKAFYRINRSVS
ncbi:hypothetical protein [Spirosoma endbachense]|uniref:Uncharacterized protein n=1 Tax=Spirosoma endbachense TaxID=2666025 RepID=A0A6P1VZB8_9BACT|nr:hypothetical protein [Spirosoma endbachense]QHV97059.1 hypothetical protein GJR95_19510 [Spirosoma endbachense]